VPVFVLTEILTIAGNELLGVDPFLKVMAAIAIAFMSVALVGLATGLGARHPRFGSDPTEVAGSYGGVAFMIQAVLFVIVMIVLLGWPTSIYMFQRARPVPMRTSQLLLVLGCFTSAAALSVTIWLASMRSGVRALNKLSD